MPITRNINISEEGESTVKIGSTTRPLWTKRVSTAFADVLMLTNTNKGYSYNLTAQLQKPYSRGWSGFVAYTYGRSKSLTDLTSSTAASNWRFAYTTNGLNRLDLANSNFDMGSRIVGTLSKEIRYSKNLATTFTLIYTGQSGQRLSYLYSRTITGDDLSAGINTMVYLPTTAAEANFVDIRNALLRLSNGRTSRHLLTTINTLVIILVRQPNVTKTELLLNITLICVSLRIHFGVETNYRFSLTSLT